MTEIRMLPVSALKPHPKNPRLDLGDLDELTDSIRASGVLQNLTVVPLPGGGTWRIIIGHRRHAAAIRAGLTELPCAVVDMSEEEQLATMMAENVQRNSLTTYEQIQGVGRMVQLGMELPEIARKTGIAEKTVRRDAKLCRSFRAEGLKAAVDKGITIQDLVELQEIEDETIRNEVMAKYGQGYPFNQAKANALYTQKERKFKARFLELIRDLPIHEMKRPNERWNGLWDTIRSLCGMDAFDKYQPFTPDEGAEYAWVCEGQNAWILRKNEGMARSRDESKKRERAVKNMEAEAERLNAECEDRRDAFIHDLPAGTKEDEARACKLLLEAILTRPEMKLRYATKFDLDDLRLVLLGEDDVGPTMDPTERASVRYFFQRKKIPDRRLAAAMALNVDHWDRKLIRVERGRFVTVPASDYALTYGILLELGYTISNPEQSLMDGTHPIYKETAEGDGAHE